MPKLSDWKWCVDFSKAPAQGDAQMPPMFFKSREEARKQNTKLFPSGRVVHIVIREIKRK